MTPEHKQKISESVRAFYAKKNKGKYDKVKYPRLPEHLNRSKKVTIEQVIQIQDMIKLGFSIREISKELGFKYHTVYYYTIPEDVRRARNHQSHLNSYERIKSDPDLHAKTLKRMAESRKRRREIHGDKWKLWDAKNYYRRYKKTNKDKYDM